jgi:hypothetical protein
MDLDRESRASSTTPAIEKGDELLRITIHFHKLAMDGGDVKAKGVSVNSRMNAVHVDCVGSPSLSGQMFVPVTVSTTHAMGYHRSSSGDNCHGSTALPAWQSLIHPDFLVVRVSE